jgi:chromate transporter
MTTSPQPASPAALFFAFQRLALQGFGGVLPVAQRELVDRRGWLSKAEFLELLSLGQVLPGPNIVNMALIYGDRCFGWRGALAAGGGLLLAPMVLVLLAAALVRQGHAAPAVNGALRGMGVVAAALVAWTVIRLAPALGRNRMGLPACLLAAAATAALVGLLRWPLVGVLALIGPLAYGWARWRLRGDQ